MGFAICDLGFGDINVGLMRVAHKELYYQGIREEKGWVGGPAVTFLIGLRPISTTADFLFKSTIKII